MSLRRTLVRRLSFLILAAVPILVSAKESGGLLWTYVAPEKILFAPTVSKGGVCYLCTDDQQVRAISRKGRLLWAVNPGGKPTTGIALQGGLLLFGTSQAELAAYGTNGRMVWRTRLDDILLSTPAVASDGTIYAATRKGTLYAVSASGLIVWSYKTGGTVVFSPAVALSGRVFVASTKNFFALEGYGRPAWIRGLATPPGSQMALDSQDGVCYLDALGILHHLDSQGQDDWHVTASAFAASPVISEDKVYLCEGSGPPPPTGHAISGKVVLNTGSGLASVTVSANTTSDTTSSDGTYTIRNLPNGTYTVTPALSGYTFLPRDLTVIVKDADMPNQNFVGTAAALDATPNLTDMGRGERLDFHLEDGGANQTTAYDLADGTTAWTHALGSRFVAALASDGAVLIPGNDYSMYLLDGTGAIAKTIPLDQTPHDMTLVALDNGNRIYVVGGDRYLFAIETTIQPNLSAPWGQLGAGPRRLSRREPPSVNNTP